MNNALPFHDLGEGRALVAVSFAGQDLRLPEGANLAAEQRIVLIAGGDGKGADFDDLIAPVNRFVRKVVLIGQDAEKIGQTLSNADTTQMPSLKSALQCAVESAVSGDIVLLSPACASIDMFKNYADRGHQFVALVEAL